jgi:hypothetical protein
LVAHEKELIWGAQPSQRKDANTRIGRRKQQKQQKQKSKNKNQKTNRTRGQG